MSDGMREKIEVHQKWGFGMAPPKEHTVVLRQKAARLVLKALSGEKSTDSDSLAEAISEVKGYSIDQKKWTSGIGSSSGNNLAYRSVSVWAGL